MSYPRVIDRLPWSDYCGLPGLHAGSLADVSVSPRAYWRRQQIPRRDSDALRVGRACHTAVLEPETFLHSYVLWDGGRRAGKEWAQFQTAAGERTILTEAQYSTALAVRDAVREHPIARVMLEERGRPELTIQWEHVRTGRLVTNRVDWLCGGVLVDLKSTRDPSPGRFGADAARLSYALKLALYSDGVAAAGLGAPPVRLIAAQNVEPYDVVVYDVDEETLALGRDQYERAIDTLIECERSNVWPGRAWDETVPLRLPSWATPESDTEQLTFGGEPVVF